MIWCFFRFTPYRLNPNVTLAWQLFIHPLCEVKIGKKATLVCEKNCTIGRNSTLATGRTGGIKLAESVFVNRNCCIVSLDEIEIQKNVSIGPNCCIYDHDHDLDNPGGYVTGKVTIKSNAWIGAGCVILKGVTIGENSVVAAGSVVTKDVPDNTILYQQRANNYKSRGK
ncbi:MAG: acyltransferase [Agathobacter sp.]|nr:acyltransferase [Agathobacter sp.]